MQNLFRITYMYIVDVYRACVGICTMESEPSTYMCMCMLSCQISNYCPPCENCVPFSCPVPYMLYHNCFDIACKRNFLCPVQSVLLYVYSECVLWWVSVQNIGWDNSGKLVSSRELVFDILADLRLSLSDARCSLKLAVAKEELACCQNCPAYFTARMLCQWRLLAKYTA